MSKENEFWNVPLKELFPSRRYSSSLRRDIVCVILDRSLLLEKSNIFRLDKATISWGIVPTILLPSKMGIVSKKDEGEERN